MYTASFLKAQIARHEANELVEKKNTHQVKRAGCRSKRTEKDAASTGDVKCPS
jgi:hypothetical protein